MGHVDAASGSALQDQILVLIDALSQGTLDRIMNMSDIALVVARLWARLDPTER